MSVASQFQTQKMLVVWDQCRNSVSPWSEEPKINMVSNSMRLMLDLSLMLYIIWNSGLGTEYAWGMVYFRLCTTYRICLRSIWDYVYWKLQCTRWYSYKRKSAGIWSSFWHELLVYPRTLISKHTELLDSPYDKCMNMVCLLCSRWKLERCFRRHQSVYYHQILRGTSW
jgi:hypothetical protein